MYRIYRSRPTGTGGTATDRAEDTRPVPPEPPTGRIRQAETAARNPPSFVPPRNRPTGIRTDTMLDSGRPSSPVAISNLGPTLVVGPKTENAKEFRQQQAPPLQSSQPSPLHPQLHPPLWAWG